jgi:phosphodiesterase/alkaline phosphatase D-like protein
MVFGIHSVENGEEGRCGRTGSTNASYDCIRRHAPLFFLCTGDFHYEDVYSSWVERYHWAYDRVLASPVQARLYWEVPLVYVWDDHDFCGNNSDGRAIGRVAVKRAYRDYFPHYPLWDESAEGPIAQSFAVRQHRPGAAEPGHVNGGIVAGGLAP